MSESAEKIVTAVSPARGGSRRSETFTAFNRLTRSVLCRRRIPVWRETLLLD